MMFYLSFIANIASLLGLGLSIWLLVGVKDIKKRILSNATLPRKMKKLETIIADLIPTKDDLTDIDNITTRAKSRGECRSILKSFSGEANKETIKEIDKAIILLDNNNLELKNQITLYEKLNSIYESLKQYNENLKLGGQ